MRGRNVNSNLDGFSDRDSISASDSITTLGSFLLVHLLGSGSGVPNDPYTSLLLLAECGRMVLAEGANEDDEDDCAHDDADNHHDDKDDQENDGDYGASFTSTIAAA